MTLFDDEEVNDDQKPTYAGHVIAVVERQAGQLFAGTLGILRPSSAATKEKQGASCTFSLFRLRYKHTDTTWSSIDAERRERDGIDIRGGDEQKNRPKIVWFKPVDKRVPLVAIPVRPYSILPIPTESKSDLSCDLVNTGRSSTFWFPRQTR